jgi:hypothetical protein
MNTRLASLRKIKFKGKITLTGGERFKEIETIYAHHQ